MSATTTVQRQGARDGLPKNSSQALLVFQGGQYKPIEIDLYSEEDFVYAQQHLCILSGLYGVLRPLDLIQT